MNMTRILLWLCLCLSASAALAHHSRTAYDLDTEIEVHGIVKEVRWRNPHVRYVLEVENDDGVTENLGLRWPRGDRARADGLVPGHRQGG